MIRKALNVAKSLVASALDRTGLLGLMVDKNLSDRVAVLMYHRIIDQEHANRTDSHPGIIVSASQFETHMRTLRDSFNPISLAQFLDCAEGRQPLPQRSCLVTFDDGWIDNYEIAFPILRDYRIPAVIFLPCNYISSDATFWQEEMLMRLTRMLRSGNSQANSALRRVLEIRGRTFPPDIGGIREFVVALKSAHESTITATLERIREDSVNCETRDHYNFHLTWDQVKEMHDSEITFASHALSHRTLPSLDRDTARYELDRSRQIIGQQLDSEVNSIAYPNGDFDTSIRSLAKASGYKAGFTTRHGFCELESDLLSIPRFNIHSRNSSSRARFICTIADIM